MSAENKADDGDEFAEEGSAAANIREVFQTNHDTVEGDCHDTTTTTEQEGGNPALSAEQSTTVNSNADVSSFQRIALTFSTQGLGFITVPLLAYPLLEFGCDADVIWRVLLGVGALPGLWVLYLRLRSRHTKNCCHDHLDTTDTGEILDVASVTPSGRTDTMDDCPGESLSQIDQVGSLEMPASKQRNEDGLGSVSGLLGGDVTGITEENDNEMALVEHSHLEGDDRSVNDGFENDDQSRDNNEMSASVINRPRGL